MRISSVLRASFVGALFFSPAMAEDVEKVHEEALRVLREAMASPAAAAAQPEIAPAASVPASPAARVKSLSEPVVIPSARPSLEEVRKQEADVAKMRAEREARLNAEARKRLADRQVQKAEERRQFEEFLKEREKLRQQQHAQDQTVSRQTSLALPATTLPKTSPPSASVPTRASASTTVEATPAIAVQAETKPPVTEAEVAPIVLAQATARSQPSAESAAEIHAKALEVLRQSMQSPAPAAAEPMVSGAAQATATPVVSAAPATSAAPSGENPEQLQERARQILREQRGSRQMPAAPPESFKYLGTVEGTSGNSGGHGATLSYEDYGKELERRAAELVRPSSGAATTTAGSQAPAMQPATTTAAPAPAGQAPASPGLDRRTREILQRQDREIAGQAQQPRLRPAPGHGLTPEAEAQARQVLRQQQEALGATTGNASAAAMPAATAPSTPVTATTAPRPTQTPPAAMAAPAATVPTTAAVSAPAVDSTYSRELEERARQILLERAQAQQQPAAAAVPTNPPAQAQPIAAPRSTAATTPTPTPKPAAQPRTPRSTPPNNTGAAQAQQQAVQAANNPPAATPEPAPAGPKSKRDRLREITDLYRADKMTPAEYHQRRAQILAEP